jgi:hypothetical protein
MKAFPCEWVEIEKGEFFELDTGFVSKTRKVPKVDTGMDLRDYFAAKAMNGIMSKEYYDGSYDDVARYAYKCADAMMKAREE